MPRPLMLNLKIKPVPGWQFRPRVGWFFDGRFVAGPFAVLGGARDSEGRDVGTLIGADNYVWICPTTRILNSGAVDQLLDAFEKMGIRLSDRPGTIGLLWNLIGSAPRAAFIDVPPDYATPQPTGLSMVDTQARVQHTAARVDGGVIKLSDVFEKETV